MCNFFLFFVFWLSSIVNFLILYKDEASGFTGKKYNILSPVEILTQDASRHIRNNFLKIVLRRTDIKPNRIVRAVEIAACGD